MTRLAVVVVFGLVPFAGIVAFVFLWNLCSAPYRLIEDQIGKSTGPHVPTEGSVLEPKLEPADSSGWRHVPVFVIWEVADLCAGISPTDSRERKNDTSKAMLTQLTRAVKAEMLHSISNPGLVSGVMYYEVTREELKRYFTELGTLPSSCGERMSSSDSVAGPLTSHLAWQSGR